MGRGVIKELSYFKSALKYCGMQTDWEIPKRLHRIPKREHHVPSENEIRIMLDDLMPESRLSLLLALLAGLRNEEVYRVGSEHYSQSEGILSIPGSIRKTGTGNVIPVCSMLEDAIMEGASNVGTLVPYSRSVVEHDLKVTCNKLGIAPWYGLQPARRSLVTFAEDAGFAQDSIALVTGHSRRSMVSRYSSGVGRLDLKKTIIESVERRINDGKEVQK